MKMRRMRNSEISAIVFGIALVSIGIIGTVISVRFLRNETDPTIKTGIRQVLFISVVGIVLGACMLLIGIFGD